MLFSLRHRFESSAAFPPERSPYSSLPWRKFSTMATILTADSTIIFAKLAAYQSHFMLIISRIAFIRPKIPPYRRNRSTQNATDLLASSLGLSTRRLISSCRDWYCGVQSNASAAFYCRPGEILEVASLRLAPPPLRLERTGAAATRSRGPQRPSAHSRPALSPPAPDQAGIQS